MSDESNKSEQTQAALLKTLTLKFGPNGANSALSIDPKSMTVFVGPNNSGKSLVLREIRQFAEEGKTAGRKIVETLKIAFPSRAAAQRLIESRRAELPAGRSLQENNIWVARTIPSTGNIAQLEIDLPHMLNRIEEYGTKKEGTPEKEPWNGIFAQFISLFTIALDGKTRFALTESRPAGDLQRAPTNHLAALFCDDAARLRVREITFDAFGLYFVIDPTNLGSLRIRMSLRPPIDNAEEQAVDQRARDFHSRATDIDLLSDGVKAFTGLISALMSSDFRVILVDEPEAFLHPPLARKLGSTMASLAEKRFANVFASTHSASFLMGCIESGTKTNIVRLTYGQGKATARHLDDSKLTTLMRDPLLRSTGVLSALFHSSAIVCEADRDRAFYEEINSRLGAGGARAAQTRYF
jgi:ABC-type polar amino acid transport system ATPase subunit